ncbi:hypothetical protein BDW42DRAFT_192862 [Aspergillus taichungensis]|uniref:Uncharacterized protein n=1 Tax=Aspergillus taichungensis TaxID=482145 RepID=A0A2J5HZ82_9EURO|nr:hypothetical protein BDW42DRAFT_192862 [Aspergillus taichungensis]
MLDTSAKPYEINANFQFKTGTCLLYAENITISSSVKIPGKNLGIFGHSLSVTENVEIDVSGKSGSAGSQGVGKNGEDGKDGADAGTVWLFVQDIDDNATKKLTIKAFGGDGGRGGVATGPGNKGGNGGNGGKGGNIEFLYGSKDRSAVRTMRHLLGQPWPQMSLNLEKDMTGTGIPDRVRASNRPTVSMYNQISQQLSLLFGSLGDLGDSNAETREVHQKLADNLKSINAPKTVSSTNIQALKDVQRKLDENKIYEAVQDLQAILVSLEPASDSMLSPSIEDIKNCLDGAIDRTQRDATAICRNMLLNKADNSFFTNTAEERQNAFGLYQRLIARLAFLAQLQADNEPPTLISAYQRLESHWKVTISPIIQLQSIHSQAKSRFNRLLLGQDMFGHRSDWAPRLSFNFYEEEVERELEALKEQDEFLKTYLKDLQEGRATTKKASEGIKSMTSDKQAAEAQIKLVTGSSGPLVMNATKIATFTPSMEQQRKDIKKRLTQVKVHTTLDPKIILDALATVVPITPSFEYLIKLANSGYDTYKATTRTTDFKGESVNLDYVVDRIATCVDDPSCVKVLSSVAKIKDMLEQFKNLIDKDNRQELTTALDKYMETILARNSAVLEYNSAVQILVEALSDQQYCQDQIESFVFSTDASFGL